MNEPQVDDREQGVRLAADGLRAIVRTHPAHIKCGGGLHTGCWCGLCMVEHLVAVIKQLRGAVDLTATQAAPPSGTVRVTAAVYFNRLTEEIWATSQQVPMVADEWVEIAEMVGDIPLPTVPTVNATVKGASE